jgi:hypothetical protein
VAEAVGEPAPKPQLQLLVVSRLLAAQILTLAVLKAADSVVKALMVATKAVVVASVENATTADNLGKYPIQSSTIS